MYFRHHTQSTYALWLASPPNTHGGFPSYKVLHNSHLFPFYLVRIWPVSSPPSALHLLLTDLKYFASFKSSWQSSLRNSLLPTLQLTSLLTLCNKILSELPHEIQNRVNNSEIFFFPVKICCHSFLVCKMGLVFYFLLTPIKSNDCGILSNFCYRILQTSQQAS